MLSKSLQNAFICTMNIDFKCIWNKVNIRCYNKKLFRNDDILFADSWAGITEKIRCNAAQGHFVMSPWELDCD